MRAFGSAHLRYLEMTPQQILAEHKDNFASSMRGIDGKSQERL
jgi:hypothetical protein